MVAIQPLPTLASSPCPNCGSAQLPVCPDCGAARYLSGETEGRVRAQVEAEYDLKHKAEQQRIRQRERERVREEWAIERHDLRAQLAEEKARRVELQDAEVDL